MSNKRYIQIDSTYRDRTLWPEPAQFEVLLSESGTRGKCNALDPVSLATPLLSFNGQFDMAANTFSITGGSVSMTIAAPISELGNASGGTHIIVEFPAGELQTTADYYNGAVLTVTTATGIEHRRITDYEFLNNTNGGQDRALFVIDSSFSDNVDDGDVAVIANPSDNSITNAQIFIPGGINADNFYLGCILEDTTINEFRTITGYDGTTRLATLDSVFGGGWAATDSYNIRKERAASTGTLLGGSTTTFLLPVTDGSGNTVNTTDNFYQGDFIRITSGGANGNVRRIGSYTGSTRTGVPTLPFSAPVAADTYEILQFNYDNATPLNYTGSKISQQEDVCYEIELISLSLPNRTLSSGVGSIISFYPYVFVEFTNITSPGSGSQGVMYSNNPNSRRMAFKASIDDVNRPLITPFIKVDSDGQTNTVRFKPNDNFKFSVRFPNGEVFKTATAETFSPNEPNALIQISAIFSIRRL